MRHGCFGIFDQLSEDLEAGFAEQIATMLLLSSIGGGYRAAF